MAQIAGDTRRPHQAAVRRVGSLAMLLTAVLFACNSSGGGETGVADVCSAANDVRDAIPRALATLGPIPPTAEDELEMRLRVAIGEMVASARRSGALVEATGSYQTAWEALQDAQDAGDLSGAVDRQLELSAAMRMIESACDAAGLWPRH